MSLINCPECGKEVSTSAIACINCGHPLAPPEPVPVIREAPPVIQRETFPKWVLIPIVVVGVLLLFTLVALYRGQQEDETNINVDLTARRQTASTRDRDGRSDKNPDQYASPTSQDFPNSTVPQTVPPQTQTEVVVPDTKPDRGTVSLEVKISQPKGGTTPVTEEKFYLLDKSLEAILREADLQPVAGQNLVNSFGLSVLYPTRFSEFRKKALDAINDHIEYETLTDASGKAKISDIKPDNYYLFGITTSKSGFSVWSSPVTVTPGENPLVLPANAMTEAKQN